MPEGLVNSGDFRNGTPIILPHQFGTPVNTSTGDGNVLPQANTSLDSNPVTWVPSPTHFGNQTGFSLQAVPPIVVVSQGGTGTTTIVITELGGFSGAVALSYSGAPAGVTVSFAPTSSTTSSTATITVVSNVPTGKYTITVLGTSGTETESTNIHLSVAVSTAPPPPPVPFLITSATFDADNDGTQTLNTTGANFLVVYLASSDDHAPTISDNKGNTWHYLTLQDNGNTNSRIGYVFNPTVGANHIFSLLTSSASDTTACIFAFSKMLTTSAVFSSENGSFSTSPSNHIQPGSVTPSLGDLIFTGACGSLFAPMPGSAMIDSGFTTPLFNDGEGSGDVPAAASYLVAPNTNPVNPKWTFDQTLAKLASNIAVFKHA